MTCKFQLEWPPRSQGRPKFSRFSGAYKSENDVEYEAIVRNAAVKAMAGADPIKGPVMLVAHFYIPMAKSWSMKKKAAHVGDWHTGRKDLDNMIKAVCDAMNGTVYEDDGQIVMISSTKSWAYDPLIDVHVCNITC